MTHYKRRVEGICPVDIYIEFESLVSEDKIELTREKVEDILAKYFDTFDVDIDAGSEDGVDLSASISLLGELEYWSGDRENPPEEEIRWDVDYESALSKIKDELLKVKNYDYVSVYTNEIDELVVDYDGYND